jgi:hypothetical protein
VWEHGKNKESTTGAAEVLERTETQWVNSKFLVFPPVPASWLRVRTGCVLRAFYMPGSLCTTGRFVSGLTLKSPHCVSSTKIHRCVIGGHRSQLQWELVLDCIHCHGYSALDGLLVYGIPISLDIPFPGGLWIHSTDTTADSVPDDNTGAELGLEGLQQDRTWLHQLHMGQENWGQITTYSPELRCNNPIIFCLNPWAVSWP